MFVASSVSLEACSVKPSLELSLSRGSHDSKPALLHRWLLVASYGLGVEPTNIAVMQEMHLKNAYICFYSRYIIG